MNYLISGGGYFASICINNSKSIISFSDFEGKYSNNCYISNRMCTNGSYYSCRIKCGSQERIWKINGIKRTFQILERPEFKIIHQKLRYGSNKDLIIDVVKGDLSLLTKEEIKINFSTNISCSNISIERRKLICKLNLSEIEKTRPNVNITVSYGFECDLYSNFNEVLLITSEPEAVKSNKSHFWILMTIVLIGIMIITTCIFIVIHKKSRKKAFKDLVSHRKKLEEQEFKYAKVQKIAFLEYQTAINSFNNLGKLTPRFVLTFDDYVSRIFNVELEKKMTENNIEQDLRNFEKELLNKDYFIKWITNIESKCQTKQRGQIASHLTLILFQHPSYFLDIIEVLLKHLISQMKTNCEEKLLFRRTEGIIEIMVGNWISLLMYPSLRIGEVGKRLFNLCRAIKCKMETGLIDICINKARYALVYDQLLFSELEYHFLTIFVEVKVNLKLMDSAQRPLYITFKELDVEVISLDTISQVKMKILDKAIMKFTKEENLNFLDKINHAISKTDHTELSLKMVTTTQLPLENSDYSTANLNEEYILINTMKHYSIKSGMKFLLTSLDVTGTDCSLSPILLKIPKKEVHLQTPVDFKNIDKNCESNPRNVKLPINPIIGETYKESYHMHLLGTKKSLSPFINGFFQSLTNNKPLDYIKSSTNSLFDTNESQITDNLLNKTDTFNPNYLSTKDYYEAPIYYLFSILDSIANSLEITDEMTIQVWKSNGFILRFWINIIKNPNFIFVIDKSNLIDGSLTTIASVLMESCSSGTKNVDLNSPVIKQLFLEDVKEYSIWWQSFVKSAYSVSKGDMTAMMDNIIEKNDMRDHYANNLRSLFAINKVMFGNSSIICNL